MISDQVPGFQTIAKKKECNGLEVAKGQDCTIAGLIVKCQTSVEACAAACIGVASMFIFGTNEFGNNRCNGNQCACFCETSASSGSCRMDSHSGYNLYAYDKFIIG